MTRESSLLYFLFPFLLAILNIKITESQKIKEKEMSGGWVLPSEYEGTRGAEANTREWAEAQSCKEQTQCPSEQRPHMLPHRKNGPQETVTTALIISLWYDDQKKKKKIKNAMF